MTHFTLAAFDPAGLLVGTAERSLAKLSPKWLSIADAYLSAHGASFRQPWQGPLAHLTTQWTSANGAALATFHAHDALVVSMAVLAGQDDAADRAVLTMFVDSLRTTGAVRAWASTSLPFEDALGIAARPLVVVVPWGDERVSAQDRGLVQELSQHLAGAFLRRPS